MKKAMIGLFAVTLGTAALAQAGGYSCGDSCASCNNPNTMCCGSFEVGAEALYLRPQSCNLGYVICDPRDYPVQDGTITTAQQQINAQLNRLPQGKNRGVDPEYDWGFRVMVGYVFDGGCSDVQVQYTWHHARDTDHPRRNSDSKGGIWITHGHPKYTSQELYNGISNPGITGQIDAQARQRIRFDYDAVDVSFGSRSMKDCNMWVRASVGLHWANLEFKRDAKYQGTINPGILDAQAVPPIAQTQMSEVRTKQCVWGIGPKFAVDARYHIACGFGIGARVGAALIAGETDGRMVENHVINPVDQTTTPAVTIPESFFVDQPLDVNVPNTSIVIPVFDARLGVNYTWCCNDCFSLVAEVGYEFISYINAIHHSVFNDQGATQSTACDSYNLQGLYIMGRVMF